MTKQIENIKFLLLIFCFATANMAAGQDLAFFIREALANNPGLRAYKSKYEIAAETIKEAKALPNTEFGLGYFVSEPETRTGAQRLRLSIKQMLPWFGTITARENYTASLAESTYLDLVIMQRKLLLEISKSYYSLYNLQSKEAVVREKRALLESYEELALTSLEVGKASAVDVLKLQIRQNDLEAQAAAFHNEFNSQKAVFRQILNRKDSLSLIFPLEIALPEKDLLTTTDSLNFHPELEKYEKLYNTVEKSILLNEREANPSIGFGLDYIAVAERPDLNFNDNGKDILMPMVSVSIPLFNSSYRSKSRQLDLRKKEINSLKIERKNRLMALLAEAFQNRETARSNYDTLLKNLKHAKDAEDILLKTYENGRIDFKDVLDIQELQLEFQLKKLDAVSDYFIASAAINYLIHN